VSSVIGLSGYGRTGKDEVAKILVEQHGYIRVAFADILRAAVYALNPYVCLDDDLAALGVYRLQELVDADGWDYVKVEYPEVRRLLQVMGTEVGRGLIGDNVWVDTAFRGLSVSRKYVFTDCRFVNEAEAIQARGGRVIRITRPGVGPVNSHASEVALDGFTFSDRIENDGTLRDLARKVNDQVLVTA